MLQHQTRTRDTLDTISHHSLASCLAAWRPHLAARRVAIALDGQNVTRLPASRRGGWEWNTGETRGARVYPPWKLTCWSSQFSSSWSLSWSSSPPSRWTNHHHLGNLPPQKTNMTGWKLHHEWRCISPLRKSGFSNVMLVFRGLKPHYFHRDVSENSGFSPKKIQYLWEWCSKPIVCSYEPPGNVGLGVN